MIGATPPSSICTGARRRQLREFAPHSPGKPYSSVEGRKPFAGKRRRRLREFAPHSRESLILPLRGANLSPGKAPAAAGVCASLPGKPYSSVEGRKPFTRKSPRRPWEFAPRSRESLILPSRGANLLQGRAAAGCGSLRLTPGKALFFRRGAQTLHPEKAPSAVGVCAPFPGKPYSSVERRKPFTRKSPRRL